MTEQEEAVIRRILKNPLPEDPEATKLMLASYQEALCRLTEETDRLRRVIGERDREIKRLKRQLAEEILRGVD
jgi:hypothetical protein